jgi:hypothetical protein
LFVAAAVILGGLGWLYTDDQHWQQTSNHLARQKKALVATNAALGDQLVSANASLGDAQQQITTLKDQLAHPTLGLWNVHQQIKGADWYLAGGIPDTFTYHLVATSTGPMSVSILTFEAFATAIGCVGGGYGRVNDCMHRANTGNVMTWRNVVSVTYDFHLAEGCANYLVVFTAASPVTVKPDVSVTYNPAPKFTGDC